MNKVKFTLDFKRIATIETPKGNAIIGDITEFVQHQDGTLSMTLEFNLTCPEGIREEVRKNPAIVSIHSTPLPTTNVIIM